MIKKYILQPYYFLEIFIGKLLHDKAHGGVLARGAIGAFIIKTAGAGFFFGLHILLARLLGAEQYGIYVYAITWLNILVIMCLLGFHTSLVRFVAEYNIKKQWGLLHGILRRSTQAILGLSFIVGILASTIIWLLRAKVTYEESIAFYIAFAILPLMAFCKQREASLRAFKKVVQSELLLQFVRPVLTGIIAVSIYIGFSKKLTTSQAMSATLTAFFFTAITGTVFLKKHLIKSVFKTKPEFSDCLWFKVSLPLLLIAGMGIILNRTDIVMLGFLQSPEKAGIYSVASRISNLVSFALMAINSILAPMVSEMYHTGQKQQLQKIIRIATWIIFIFTLGTSAILVISGKFILSLFGLKFITAFVPLLILLLGQIANSLSGSVGLIMSMSGRQNIMSVLVALSALSNILLNLFLIPLLGIAGAAISTAATMALRNITMLTYVKSQIGINSTIFGSWKNA